jgi:hypothetical protein
VFPPQTNDFQKPIKFVSTLGKVFFGKESEKASGEEPVEKPSDEKPVEKPSGEKPSEQPHPKLIKFHCGYCGKDGHKDGSVRRGWQRSGRTRICTTLPMVYLSLVCHCPGVKLL